MALVIGGAGSSVQHPIAANLVAQAFPGRRSANSLTWGGLANSYYWIDPARKVTGVWATQLLPFYDPHAIKAFEAFERAVYASL